MTFENRSLFISTRVFLYQLTLIKESNKLLSIK